MIARDFAAGGVVRNQVKDLRHALGAAAECGLELPVTGLVAQLFQALEGRAGGAELDHSALILELGGK
jgi:2-hydroxy-3-oxopropionate reductase